MLHVDWRSWGRALWLHPILFLLVAMLGAAGSFAYSYAPLHRAKDWKVEYLESRLDKGNLELTELREGLAAARAQLDDSPPAEEVKALRATREQNTELSASKQREIDALERKLEGVTRSRNSWKSKHAKVVAAHDSLEEEIARTARAEPAAAPPVQAIPNLGDASPSNDEIGEPAESAFDAVPASPSSASPSSASPEVRAP
jgi:hypothetical protein